MSEKLIECPFCEKGKVKTLHKESYMQASESRISAGSKYTFRKKPDVYEVLEGCSNCGKSKKEIQDYLDGKEKSETDPKELKKRLKEAGLPTEIEYQPK